MLVERISIDPRVKETIYRKFKGRCYYCGTPLTYGESTIDHFVPLAKGGGNNVNNFVLCCHDCNNLKGDKSVDEFKLSMYSLLANALKYINNNRYNCETGDLQFFGEEHEDKFEEIDEADKHKLNSLMKPSMPQYKKYLTKPSKPNYEDYKDIPIENPYGLNGKILEEYPDDEWKNDPKNTYVEKQFLKFCKEEKEFVKKEIIIPESVIDERIAKIKEEIIQEKNQKEEKSYEPNFILVENIDYTKIKFKVVKFNIPKSLSDITKKFLDQIKYLIEMKNMSEEETLIKYYDMMDHSKITEKQYQIASKELIKKDIINKHKKFRPRSISINYFN